MPRHASSDARPSGYGPASPEPQAVGFVRLAVGTGGVFHAAYALRDGGSLTGEARRDLWKVLRWFSAELTAYRPAEPTAVFWFKADAREHVSRVRLLQLQGQDVRMWTSRPPGRVLFEDRFQAAAVPSKSTLRW